MDSGLDSLAAVELRNAIAARFAISLPATAAFDHPTVAHLARFVASQLPADQPDPRARPSEAPAPLFSVMPARGAAAAEEVLPGVLACVAEVLDSAVGLEDQLMQVCPAPGTSVGRDC